MSNEIAQNAEQHPSPALIERFIDIQEKELVIRTQEIDLKKQSDNNAHDYAKAALDANIKDRTEERKHAADVIKLRYIFSGIIIVGLIIFLGFALSQDKDQIVMEIIKAIMFFCTGGIGGYAVGKRAKNNN